MQTEIKIEQINTIAEKAGKKILEIRKSGKNNIYHKNDVSPFTDADLASNEIIMTELTNLDINIPIISEENGHKDNIEALTDGLSKGKYWLVDSLDGTRGFIDGHDYFAVNIALMEENEFGRFLPTK